MYDIFTRLLIDDFTSKVFHAREIQFGNIRRTIYYV